MLGFICKGSAELYGMERERKIQNENICLQRELNILSYDILKYICANLNMHCDNRLSQCIFKLAQIYFNMYRLSQCIFKLAQIYFNMSCDNTPGTPRQVNQLFRPLCHDGLTMMSGLMSYGIVAYKLIKPLQCT